MSVFFADGFIVEKNLEPKHEFLTYVLLELLKDC